MRCTLEKHDAPGGHGYHLNIVGATASQHSAMDKMNYLSIVDVKVIVPAELVEDEQTPPNIARDEIAGAIARGWCHPKNEKKIMDVDLAEAITDEVLRQLSPVA